MTGGGYDPRTHYDHVTDAWSLLLGADLHYGVFDTPTEPLAVATARLTDAMIEAVRPEPGLSVLDVGCGTGHSACRLAAEQDVAVLGITPSTIGIHRATARAAAAGLSETVRFEARDGMANGLPDDSTDRVWVLESSHLMRHRDRLISECARVLRPGGRIALCDLMLARPMPFEEVRRLHKPLGTLRDAFGAARMETRDRYEQLFADNGIDVDVSLDLTEATRPTFDAWRRNAALHEAAVVAQIGRDGLDAFLASCDILDGFWGDGTMGYGLIAGRLTP
ncbi:MAG TPA: methyltransferase domain-containing protein [Mycobacteriales bacterium]|nr:methyltransferase domain-containing protein [Mycobacteriales bacterium]